MNVKFFSCNKFHTGKCLSVVAVLSLFLSACASTPTDVPVDSPDHENPVGEDSSVAISDYWLRKYNVVAQSALERAYRYGQAGFDNRISRIIETVVNYDQRNANYFASEFYEELERKGRRDRQNYRFLEIFRRHGVIINTNYAGYYDDFLWKLGDDYTLPESTRDLLLSLFPNDVFVTPTLETVTTDQMSANIQSGHMAFLSPTSIRNYSQSLGWSADDLIHAVAAHEAAHQVMYQVIDELIGKDHIDNYFRNNLDELSGVVTRIDFYHEHEVNEFMADAIAIQTSAMAINADQVIGFFASRVLQETDAFQLVEGLDRKKRKIRKAPHFASAEFIFSLFEDEEKRRVQQGEEPGSTIAELRSQRKTSVDWQKEHWLPYLEKMITPEFATTVQQEYLLAFNSMRQELRLF